MNLVFIHVPKCAGTSVINALRTHYGDSLFHDLSFRRVKLRHLAWPWQQALPTDPIDLPDDYPETIRCVAGHFKWQKYAYLPWPNVVFLREPVARLVSQYSIGNYRELKTLEKWVEESKDCMTEQIGNLDRYSFIGLQEHFEESIAMLERYAGISFTRPLVYRNHHKRRKIVLTPGDRDFIIANNQRDMELYREAQDRFNEQRREYREA